MTSMDGLIIKMRRTVDMIEGVLRDPNLTSEVQISDVNTTCWAMVELCHRLQSQTNLPTVRYRPCIAGR